MPESLPQNTSSWSPLAQAIAASGLVAPDELQAAAVFSRDDPQRLGDQLVARGLLTAFQLQAFREGRGGQLRLGNYDLLDQLGAGGMGTVYKARHRRMKRLVALKVLAAKLSQNPLFVQRFQREVETIACLGHPNVVMAYDADEGELGHFLVMEFVPGRDLAGCVERDGPFPVPRAVDIILQAARGLAYAHEQGLVHRDIKPQNLLLDDHGVVKVTDLGLARLSAAAAESAAAEQVTMAGGVIGTPDYMSPEQAVDSTTIDQRADIYSLGCTLYYLLTGTAPYRGNTVMSLLLKHRDAPIPSLREKFPETPAALDELFQRMLAKTPEQRVQRMVEVVATLEAIGARLGFPAGTPLPRASSRAGQETFTATSSLTQFAPPAASGPAGGTPAISVVIVEPSRVQVAIIRNYLQDQAFSVVGAATSGQEAIELVEQTRPRAVISARYLSDIDGLELAERIRTEFQGHAPGFVLVTSGSAEGPAESGALPNRVVLLAKPFSAPQLLETLNQVTGVSRPLEPAVSGGREARPRDRRRARVLIVDDSATARLQVRTVLQHLGFADFLEVADGAQAIAVAAREVCDLIVTDYNMPLMDGRALVSYLKQNPATTAIPILMVTTETAPEVLDPVRRLGVVAIVEKAFPATVVGPLLDSLF